MSTKTEVLNLRIDKETKSTLRNVSQRLGLSMSQLVTDSLGVYIDKRVEVATTTIKTRATGMVAKHFGNRKLTADEIIAVTDVLVGNGKTIEQLEGFAALDDATFDMVVDAKLCVVTGKLEA